MSTPTTPTTEAVSAMIVRTHAQATVSKKAGRIDSFRVRVDIAGTQHQTVKLRNVNGKDAFRHQPNRAESTKERKKDADV